MFSKKDWKLHCEYVRDEVGGRHQVSISPLRDVDVQGTLVSPHDRVTLEQSWKFTRAEVDTMWSAASLSEIACWVNEDQYGKSRGRDGGVRWHPR